MTTLIELKLIEFELQYRPYFDYAASLGNYNGFFGPPAVLSYMIWRSLFSKNITMSFCWGDDGRDNYYLFQDFVNEKSLELPADEVDAIIKKIDKIGNIEGWRFYKGKKLGYKTLLPDFGGKMVDEFLNEVEAKLSKIRY
jgi:hypothetical protein